MHEVPLTFDNDTVNFFPEYAALKCILYNILHLWKKDGYGAYVGLNVVDIEINTATEVRESLKLKLPVHC